MSWNYAFVKSNEKEKKGGKKGVRKGRERRRKYDYLLRFYL